MSDQPVVDRHVEANWHPEQPGNGRPEAGQPGDGRPEAGQPEVGQPEVGQPEVGQPEAGQIGQQPAASPETAAAEVDTAERAEEQLELDLQLLLEERARVAAERDEYLELSRRVQADFENYKKRIIRQQTEHLERAAAALIEKLLPVLDSIELAVAHGTEGIEPIHRSLMDVLEAEGLERIDPVGMPFDPNEHEAVVHEAGEGGPVVVEVLRPGYRFKGRVLRPAMVKVHG